MKLSATRAVLHHLHPRRPGTRSVDRRDHHADLPDLDLRAGRSSASTRDTSTRARRTRRARRSRRTSPRSKAARRASRSPRAWRRSAPSRPCSSPATTSSSPTTLTAERSDCSTRCCAATSWTFSYVDTSQLGAHRTGAPSEYADAVRRDADQPGDAADRSRAAAEIAARRNVRLVVDNTFASPCLQRPLELGADLVVHSTTKYLNGHSDSIGGIVVAARDDDIEWLRFIQNAEGAILSPIDSWLVLRGTKTLAVRMAQHNANGQAIAEFLAAHPKVQRVLYPGPADPSAARAREAADARLRRDAVVRRRHVRGRAARAATASG